MKDNFIEIPAEVLVIKALIVMLTQLKNDIWRRLSVHLLSNALLKHTTMIFAGMAVVHICNLLFQMAVSRRLPEEEYALLAAFLGILAILGRPLISLQTAISHHFSVLIQESRFRDLKRLLVKWLWLTGTPSFILGIVVMVGSPVLSSLLHLDRLEPVLIVGATLPALFMGNVFHGAGQGLQLFGMTAMASIAGAVVRLALGAGFVWFLYPACGWAMLGHSLGLYTVPMFLLPIMVLMFRGQQGSSLALPRMRFYLFQSFVIQIAYAVLLTADVVMVKHFLPTDGEFAYAATLGRLVVFLPGAIVMAMFPKVASKGKGSCAQHKIFLQSLMLTLALVFFSVLVCVVFPGLLARILFGIGHASQTMTQQIGWLAVAMGLSALLNVTMLYLLAQRRYLACSPVPICALLYVVLVAFYHSTSWHVVWLAILCNGLALLGCLTPALMTLREVPGHRDL